MAGMLRPRLREVEATYGVGGVGGCCRPTICGGAWSELAAAFASPYGFAVAVERIGSVGGQRAGLDLDLDKDVRGVESAFGDEYELLPNAGPVMRLAGEPVPEPPAGLPGLAHRNQELARRGAPKRRHPCAGTPQSSSEPDSLNGACSATEDVRSLRSRRVMTTPKTA